MKAHFPCPIHCFHQEWLCHLPMWERVVLCAIYYFVDPVGGEIHNPHRESTGNRKASLGHQRKPKGTTRKPIGISRESNGFNRKSIGTNRKSIAMKGNRKESTGNQKAGWLAPSILNAHPSYSPRERKKPCAIYFFVASFPKITTHQKPCAIYPP